MSNVRAIVAGHGTFAEGMLSAIEQITGRSDLFIGVSNRDLSAQDVERLLRERLAASGATVIFTDLPAGSCTMAARRLQRETPALAVVTGVNLATLLVAIQTITSQLPSTGKFDVSVGTERDLSGYSTFAWNKGQAAVESLANHLRIINAVQKQMKELRFRIDTVKPDVLVQYRAEKSTSVGSR